MESEHETERDERIENFAAWLHESTRDLEHMVEGYEWPLHDNDDGYRGDGGYVRLIPRDIVEHHRELARRASHYLAEHPAVCPKHSELDWRWYAGGNDERFIIGPCESQEQALREAEDYDWETIHIVEAAKEPVRVSRYFEVDALFNEIADDPDIGDPDGDAVEVGASEDQAAELQDLVRAAIDEWQTRHEIVIDPWVFTHTRNAAYFGKCPICDVRLKPDDLCATDITEGTCHAKCLDGSPIVDLETGEEISGPATTFIYGNGDGENAVGGAA